MAATKSRDIPTPGGEAKNIPWGNKCIYSNVSYEIRLLLAVFTPQGTPSCGSVRVGTKFEMIVSREVISILQPSDRST
jgi:hypothetical protein